jgi:hypothetical protein
MDTLHCLGWWDVQPLAVTRSAGLIRTSTSPAEIEGRFRVLVDAIAKKRLTAAKHADDRRSIIS